MHASASSRRAMRYASEMSKPMAGRSMTHARSTAGSPSPNADQPNTPVTSASATEKEASERSPCTTVGVNSHSGSAARAASQRRATGSGSRPVPRARSTVVAIPAATSIAERAGRSKSVTTELGIEWMAAIAPPTAEHNCPLPLRARERNVLPGMYSYNRAVVLPTSVCPTSVGTSKGRRARTPALSAESTVASSSALRAASGVRGTRNTRV